MRRFLKKLGLFATLGLLLLALICAAMINDTVFLLMNHNRTAAEVHTALRRSRSDHPARVLVLGDSVAGQMFNHRNQTPGRRHLLTNQAISLVGQYLLARRALPHTPGVKEIHLILHPHSLRNDLDDALTFNYFCKPFYARANLPHLSPLVRQRLARRPWHRLALIPAVKTTNLLPDINYDHPGAEPAHPNYLSPVSLDYLVKLRALAAQHRARLRVLSAPVSRHFNHDFAHMRAQIAAAGLDDVFADFFARMPLRDDTDFSDHVHLRLDLIAEISATYPR